MAKSKIYVVGYKSACGIENYLVAFRDLSKARALYRALSDAHLVPFLVPFF